MLWHIYHSVSEYDVVITKDVHCNDFLLVIQVQSVVDYEIYDSIT